MTQKLTQSYAILDFYKKLSLKFDLPEGVAVMNPFIDKDAWQITSVFYNKFYNDAEKRVFIFGINPGRFGGGITGIPFTDPVRLETACGISNNFQKKAELSSQFVYAVIDAYGGAEKFYRHFFITALSPLGYTKNGINLNYYDDKELLKVSEAFIVKKIRKQLDTIGTSDTCFCLGEGTNYKIFQRLNEQHKFFKEIVPLPHPRWVMQYRRKKLDEYINLYVQSLKRIS